MVPGGVVARESAEGSSCQGEPRVPTTRPCEGTDGKLVGMARNCEDTNIERRESWLLEPVV